MLDSAYKDKTVLVTGHTGFKGSWLCEWLLLMEAQVVGYALEPPSNPSLYESTGLSDRLVEDVRADLADVKQLQATLNRHKPDFVFHLAAQPLVRYGFEEPVETFTTNVAGTMNVLEALRVQALNCVVVLVTTDKVYENAEWLWSYRENDPLGGYDPYSASKACAEIVISSYRRSFFPSGDLASASVASVRGGNVVGGGDWAADRIVPDSIGALTRGEAIPVRNKIATRPWQHVLELVGGYLHLGREMAAARALGDAQRLDALCDAYNFGPMITSNRSVQALVEELLKHWPGEWQDLSDPAAVHEAGRLNLTIDRAYHNLNWMPLLSFEQTIAQTVSWYQAYNLQPQAIGQVTVNQIKEYLQLVAESPWANARIG